MDVQDILKQMGGIPSVARELNVSESQAGNAAAALLPAILGGFKKQSQGQSNGLDGLVSMLEGLGGGGLLDEVLGPQPTNVNRGNDVLGKIFGTPDVSRAVAQAASTRTGLNPALLRKMLPFLAMLVAGYIAKRGGPSQARTAGAGGRLGGILRGLLISGRKTGAYGQGGLRSMLDLNGNGNSLDDILGMAGKVMR